MILMPADMMSSNGARPSAGTVLNNKLNMFIAKFLSLLMILYHLFKSDDLKMLIYCFDSLEHDNIDTHTIATLGPLY